MGVRFSNVVVTGESDCVFFGLLGACVLFRLSVLCCDSGADLVPVASLSRVRLFGFLHCCVCFVVAVFGSLSCACCGEGFGTVL